jgi:hypothetical protein
MPADVDHKIIRKSGLRDNRGRGSAADFIKTVAAPGSSLSIVSAYFTSAAYDRLGSVLDQISSLRFLFGEPRFLSREGALEAGAYVLDEDELSLEEGLRKRAVAARCAEWIRSRVEIRSIKRAGLLHGKLFHVHDGRRDHAMVGSSNFTARGLGLSEDSNIELNLIADSDRDREEMLAWFDEIWTDQELTEDVRDEVLRQLERLYRHNSPEFIYFKTLFHLFEADLLDQVLEDEQFADTRFTETAIWNMLYGFQRDGVRAGLSKLDRHGGCILADSVGLGKTFTALAVIKWYELRNKSVLVLLPQEVAGQLDRVSRAEQQRDQPASGRSRRLYRSLPHGPEQDLWACGRC